VTFAGICALTLSAVPLGYTFHEGVVTLGAVFAFTGQVIFVSERRRQSGPLHLTRAWYQGAVVVFVINAGVGLAFAAVAALRGDWLGVLFDAAWAALLLILVALCIRLLRRPS